MPLRVIKALVLGVLNACIISAHADDFARATRFESVGAFVAAASAFHPAAAKTDLAALFTVREPGQSDEPKTGTRVPATSVHTAASLWSDASHALVFATAMPPTEATHSAVGVLFLLSRGDRFWQIADLQRFTATGKYADVSAELTAGTGSGYQLGNEGMMPIVTVKESQGGRGYGYQISASYTFGGSKLKRMTPE